MQFIHLTTSLLCVRGAAKLDAEVQTRRAHCTRGPYVWYPIKHRWEGIGSTFQRLKKGMIMADALAAPWIGTLENHHDPEPRENNAEWFGLGDKDCNETMLKQYEKLSLMHFVNATSLYQHPYFSVEHMCANKIKSDEYRKKFKLGPNTVIKVGKRHFSEEWNYCVFNQRFRERFYRDKPRKNPQEFWISVHFRWGDVATHDVERPNFRARQGLTTLAKKVAKYTTNRTQARVFFFSEGKEAEFKKIIDLVPPVNMRLNGSWKESLYTMAQSDVLIGGTSSFFVLAAHLCQRCTVSTFVRDKKFRQHPDEFSDNHFTLTSKR